MASSNPLLSRSGKTPLEVATKAAKKAGKILVDHFGSTTVIKQKSRGNLVTEVDALSEKLILDLLRVEYPNHRVLSEETNSSTTVEGYTWIVDPLDGTNNYVFGVPHFCVNIALAENHEILLGLTYDPMKKELFHAEKGHGAHLNGKPLQVSQVPVLEDSLVGFDLGYNDAEAKLLLSAANKLWGRVHCMRMMGSAALGLAYVACGRMSLYFHRYIYPWDIASGILLIREAGGDVVDWEGKRASVASQKVVASSKRLCKKFLSEVST